MVNCDGSLIQFSYPKPNITTVRIILDVLLQLCCQDLCFILFVCCFLLCARCQLGRNWLHIVP